MDGKTVEINNTDAEGRLTLGDAITYARTEIKPDEIFDFATLTGACMVALGPYTAGVMGNDLSLVERWLAAARLAGEEMWRLPLPDRLREQLKSEIADMRNTGDRYGGALTAGLFLKEFVGDTPWVHVDIAGPASARQGTRPRRPRAAPASRSRRSSSTSPAANRLCMSRVTGSPQKPLITANQVTLRAAGADPAAVLAPLPGHQRAVRRR